MKRKGIALVVMMFLLIVTGCTSREYESNMDLGKEQVQDQNYLEAYEAFTSAYKENDTAEAKELKELSKLLADGISKYKQEKYEEALSFFEKAAGYDAKTKVGKQLVSKADEWVTKVDNASYESSPAKEGQLGPNDPATLEEGNMEMPEGMQDNNSGQAETPSDSGNSDGNNQGNTEGNSGNDGTSKLSVKEAEQLVKDFIEIKDYPQLSVEFDHNDDNGDYIFQVFESVEDGQGGHTATWGWYGVNPKTKEVYDIM